MATVGIFFGSDTGNTENIAKMIQKQLGKDVAEVHDIAKSSKEDLEGWSPEINGSRAAFFENFQEGDIVWADLYPNKRIPRAFQTDTCDLYGALVIEVDLEVDSGISKQVLPCTSTLSVTSTSSVTGLEGTPKHFQGHHDRVSWSHCRF